MKQFEAYRLDSVNECLWHNGTQIVLPPKPFAVLRYLVERPGRLVSHDELLDALWPETYVQPQVLRTYVLDLRKALGDDAGQPRFIQTLPKRGYSFVARVADVPDSRSYTESEFASTGDSSEFVGRTSELALLNSHLNQLTEDRRSVLLITGEAGIGKTALLDAFCRQVEQSKAAAIARGQCIQGVSSREHHYPILEALGHLCSSPDGEIACRVLAKVAPAWAAHASTSSPANEPVPERTLSSLCSALEELSIEKPLLLFFEDLDWADESTLHLISALARRRARARLMVLCTFRPNCDAELQQLRQDLLLRRLAVEISLSPLARPAIAQLLRKGLKAEDMPVGLDHFIYQRAEGNPLFATAILEHLIAQRVLVRDANAAGDSWKLLEPLDQVQVGVPEQLASMIETDIARLTAEEQSALEAASLMNIAFPAWAVAAALEKPVAEAEENCECLAQRVSFLGRAGQDELPDGTRSSFYVFTHQIYRDAIYNRQSPARRDRRHIRIANRLRELFAGREADVAREITMHYEAAGAWREACGALRLSAERARRREALAEAAEFLERALRLAENLQPGDRSILSSAIREDLARLQDPLAGSLVLQEEAPQKA